MKQTLLTICTLFIVGTCTAQENSDLSAAEASAHDAHENYISAINSNNLDSVLAMLTEDVVFLAANTPVMVGKDAVRPWIEGYLQAFNTYWDKTMEEFTVCGEWAFERYSYKSIDTSLTDGSVIEGSGWGLIIYHHDSDGIWRVARDAFGPDQPAGE